jgi:hypothetical protein
VDSSGIDFGTKPNQEETTFSCPVNLLRGTVIMSKILCWQRVKRGSRAPVTRGSPLRSRRSKKVFSFYPSTDFCSFFSFFFSSSLNLFHLDIRFNSTVPTSIRLPSVRLPWSRARPEARHAAFPRCGCGGEGPELFLWTGSSSLGVFIVGQGIVLGITVTAHA